MIPERKMSHEESYYLTDFVMKRLEQLDRKPRFFGRKAWEKRVSDFRRDFSQTLEQGTNTFYGAIWKFFEMNDKVFIGKHDNGMRELAEHTLYEEGQWYYHNPYTHDRCLIFPNGNY